MFRFCHYALALILAASFLHGCAGKQLPIDLIKKEFRDVPTYAIILDDMEERGAFFKNYYHKYRIVQQERSWTTDWMKVPQDYYRRNANFLGMTLAAKKKGEFDASTGPPGYHYVGDDRYGNWRRDSGGNSFWVFYGQYAFLSHMLGGHRVFRNDYNTYRDYRTRNRPYYGRNNEFGTKGTITKRQKPNFYARQTAKAQAKKASFSNRVNQRTGRSRAGYRSRSTSWGK
ncbi:MAG: hypothetical protein JRI95_07165 [Deltaproteobacteria bacterium]|nr:hypothetical protein [Deltaproteobacteria bacterium]